MATYSAAIVIWMVGVALYLGIAGLPQLGLSGLAPWLGATLPTYLFGVVVYAIVGRSATRSVSVVAPSMV